MKKWRQGIVGVAYEKTKASSLPRQWWNPLRGGWLTHYGLSKIIAMFILLAPAVLFSKGISPLDPSGNAASSGSVAPALEKIPWLAIIGVALGLGFVAFLVLRIFGGEGRSHSSGRSRGGWILSNNGVDEAHATAGDEESSGSSSSFNGGGAGRFPDRTGRS